MKAEPKLAALSFRKAVSEKAVGDIVKLEKDYHIERVKLNKERKTDKTYLPRTSDNTLVAFFYESEAFLPYRERFRKSCIEDGGREILNMRQCRTFLTELQQPLEQTKTGQKDIKNSAHKSVIQGLAQSFVREKASDSGLCLMPFLGVHPKTCSRETKKYTWSYKAKREIEALLLTDQSDITTTESSQATTITFSPNHCRRLVEPSSLPNSNASTPKKRKILSTEQSEKLHNHYCPTKAIAEAYFSSEDNTQSLGNYVRRVVSHASIIMNEKFRRRCGNKCMMIEVNNSGSSFFLSTLVVARAYTYSMFPCLEFTLNSKEFRDEVAMQRRMHKKTIIPRDNKCVLAEFLEKMKCNEPKSFPNLIVRDDGTTNDENALHRLCVRYDSECCKYEREDNGVDYFTMLFAAKYLKCAFKIVDSNRPDNCDTMHISWYPSAQHHSLFTFCLFRLPGASNSGYQLPRYYAVVDNEVFFKPPPPKKQKISQDQAKYETSPKKRDSALLVQLMNLNMNGKPSAEGTISGLNASDFSGIYIDTKTVLDVMRGTLGDFRRISSSAGDENVASAAAAACCVGFEEGESAGDGSNYADVFENEYFPHSNDTALITEFDNEGIADLLYYSDVNNDSESQSEVAELNYEVVPAEIRGNNNIDNSAGGGGWSEIDELGDFGLDLDEWETSI